MFTADVFGLIKKIGDKKLFNSTTASHLIMSAFHFFLLRFSIIEKEPDGREKTTQWKTLSFQLEVCWRLGVSLIIVKHLYL